MTEFIDPYPELPLMIDIGGIKYYMGNLKPVELAYRSRSEFKNTFGNNPRTEYILRKYMHPELRSKSKLKFSSQTEKDELIKILETRAKQLQSSKEISSSLLKNTIFQKSYLDIQALIQNLKGAEFKPMNEYKISGNDIIPCAKAKKYSKEISEDKRFELILELAWFLLHPEQLPKDIECSWNKLIKELDTLRLGDIMEMIRTEQEKKGIQTDLKPLNYLEKINISKVSKSPTIQNALIQARNMALNIQDENAKKDLENRIKILLNLLEVKKYLKNSLPVDESRMKIIDNTAADKISKTLITNPMRGGAGALDKPLGIAMLPMYTYFKSVYDPVYSFIESSIQSYSSDISITGLTTLLHICNNLNRPANTNIDRDIYGIYRIKNIDDRVLSFINYMLNSTTTYLEKYTEKEDKYSFNKQISTLPRVRLTTLISKNSSIFNRTTGSVPYVQFFILDNNLTIPSENDFISLTKPFHTSDVFNELRSFFDSKDLYILFTKSDNAHEDIPMNVFEIDYDAIDIEENSLKVENLDDNLFNKTKADDLHLDKLVSLKEYVTFNDAELALSIFIAFKELAPK